MATGNKKTCNAQYWAVGYTNGGANETRLGPFVEQSDAIKAGMVEQGKARGFTLSGVVDESGKYVYSNAKTCNAKFKVGDKVISKSRKHLGPAKITDETDDEYVVKFDNGMRDMLEKDDVVAANSAPCTNSVVANAMAANGNKVACNIQSEYEITYKDGFKEWRESYGGRDLWRQTYTMRQIHGDPVKFKTDDGKEVPLREVMGNSEGAVARNSEAYDIAQKAGKRFKDAFEAIAGCESYLERLSTLGQPDDVRGNDEKIAAWAKGRLQKVRDIRNRMDQGRLSS